MLAELTAGYQATKATLDIAKGIQALKTEAEINSAVIDIQRLTIEAQQNLMQAQASHTSLVGRVAQLEEEIANLKDWSAERECYQLVDVYRGAFAFMPKPGMERGQPAHWLCTNCFDQGRKSYMQFKGQDRGPGGSNGQETAYGCNGCKGSIKVGWRTKPTYSPEAPA